MADTSEPEDLKAADAQALHRTVREEGQAELRRPTASLFWSGLAAGIAITASLIAEGSLRLGLPDAPWRETVVALGYPVGFMLVILGRMQLFTESTITAMLPLITRPSRWALAQTLRLWGIVLGANLAGTALASLAVASGAIGHPGLDGAIVKISRAVLRLGPIETFFNAIPAGFLIAILAWSLANARSQSVVVIGIITYVVAAAGFSHSVAGSDEVFLLMWKGEVTPAQAVFALILPAVLGNLVGGAGIFALLAHGQVRGEMAQETGDGED